MPGEGLGGTTVEHVVARSADDSRKGDYANCLYACRFCNRSRSAQPPRRGEAHLLDPTRDRWAEHFSVSGDLLKPAEGDLDAAYTHRAYQLDDPRKVERRRIRRQLISNRLRLRRQAADVIPELLGLANVARQRRLPQFGDIVAKIRDLRQEIRQAEDDLWRYEAVPDDAPKTCRCGERRHHSLPPAIDAQTLELDREAEGGA